MKTVAAPLHTEEDARLQSLYEREILDTKAEKAFDRIVFLAKNYFSVPIALVSFVDKDRQWFKSCTGLKVQETSRDVAFCAHAIVNDAPLIVKDATSDIRFHKNPLVCDEPNIRFYAGIPISVDAGLPLGTLCIIDTVPRPEFSEHDTEVLTQFAELVIAAINAREEKRLAEDRNSAKTEFLSHISHELRTPLTAIVGVSQLLSSRSNLDDENKNLIRKLSSSSKLLLELINSVLDISAIESRSISLQDDVFSLDACLDEIHNIIAPQAILKGLDFSIECKNLSDVDLKTDYARFKQILANLLENSLKFTDNGHIKLLLSGPTKPCASTAGFTIEVVDTGVGISTEDMPSVFKQFKRGHSVKRTEGSGLGLYIVTGLVQKMAGQIEVESTVGAGSRFTIHLPSSLIISDRSRNADKPKQIQAEAVLSRTPPLDAKKKIFRILLAEDYADNATVLKEIINLSGYHCDIAVDGCRALEMLNERDYDIVLMDIDMPIMDGIACTKAIRSENKFKHIPIIALSAHVFKTEIERCKAAGMDDTLSKPINLKKLLNVLNKYLHSDNELSGQ